MAAAPQQEGKAHRAKRKSKNLSIHCSLLRPNTSLHAYRITLSAWKRIESGIVTPSSLAVFKSTTSTYDAQVLKEIENAAGPLAVNLRYLEIRSPNDFGTAFRAAVNEKAEAALVRVSGFLVNPSRTEIVGLAVKSRLPVMYERADEVDAGGLMSYGVSIPDLYRRAATYVDKILKGAKSADLPIEQPTKFELVINLKAAKQIGLTIPESVVFRADRVIK